jgi:hypothetical protein
MIMIAGEDLELPEPDLAGNSDKFFYAIKNVVIIDNVYFLMHV